MNDIFRFICKLFKELVDVKNIASFIITVLGVFYGYLLSSKQYRRQRKVEEDETILKYLKLLKNEMKSTIITINHILEMINEPLEQPELGRTLIVTIYDLVQSCISDEIFSIIFRLGIVKILMIDKIQNFYNQQKYFCQYVNNQGQFCSGVAILANPQGYLKILEDIKEQCNYVNEKYIIALDDIRNFGNSLLTNNEKLNV